jgi:hypothetical protein
MRMSILRWGFILLSAVIFTQAASASLVEISAHFPKAEYIAQYDQLPGKSQVATFSILESGIVIITAEWSTWYPEIGFGRFGIVWKSPDSNWTDIPPFGEVISAEYTTNGRKIEQKDEAKHQPLNAVITYRVSKNLLPMEKYQVAMQRPNFWEGSHSQKVQDSHMTMDFIPDAGRKNSQGNNSGTDTVVGIWNWFTGTKLYVHTDGSFEAWKDSELSNYGTWTKSGNNYTFNWVNGGYIDILTLSPDKQNLDGYNKGGTHITGNRISSEDIISGSGTIVGTWNWFTGTKVYIHGNGAFEAWQGNTKNNYGTWSKTGNQYTFHWVDGGYTDTLSLSPDGKNLDGYNKGGTHVTGSKISAEENVSGSGMIVGTWSWFTGTKVYIHSNGTFEAWQGNTKSNYGTWTKAGNIFTFHWIDGGYIDTLNLSQDGKNLDGYNKGGTHVTGNKISSSDVK